MIRLWYITDYGTGLTAVYVGHHESVPSLSELLKARRNIRGVFGTVCEPDNLGGRTVRVVDLQVELDMHISPMQAARFASAIAQVHNQSERGRILVPSGPALFYEVMKP